MLWIAALVLLMGLALGPTLWVRHVMRNHAADRPDYPGTGGEFARHLLDHHGLSQELYEGRSVTAVAVAAHEVGHALQDRDAYRPLKWCHRLVSAAALTDRVGTIVIFGLSALGGAALSPRFFLFGVAAVVLIGLVRVAAHLVMLPVEFDASFRRAMPIIDQGRYLPAEDMPAAHAVLKAAAYTYVAASLFQVLNLFRILRAFR